MTLLRAATIAVLLMLSGGAHAEQPLPRPGFYEVTFRLELPHLERWAIPRTATICIAEAEGQDGTPIPVLSGNNPFETCAAANVRRNGARLDYDILCEGRDAPKAKATYSLGPGKFRGRIRIVMGGKNMTMTEVQDGHRVGGCELAATRAATRQD